MTGVDQPNVDQLEGGLLDIMFLGRLQPRFTLSKTLRRFQSFKYTNSAVKFTLAFSVF